MQVDLSQLLGRTGCDRNYAKIVESFHWYMPVEDESPEEFPHQDRRISLDDMTVVKNVMVAEASFLHKLGDESYLHPSGVLVEFGMDSYLPKSAAEEEKKPLMSGAYPRKDAHRLSFYSTSRDVIKLLAEKCNLPMDALREEQIQL